MGQVCFSPDIISQLRKLFDLLLQDRPLLPICRLNGSIHIALIVLLFSPHRPYGIVFLDAECRGVSTRAHLRAPVYQGLCA